MVFIDKEGRLERFLREAYQGLRNKRKKALYQEIIDSLNEREGGDWYFRIEMLRFEDSVTDRVVWLRDLNIKKGEH